MSARSDESAPADGDLRQRRRATSRGVRSGGPARAVSPACALASLRFACEGIRRGIPITPTAREPSAGLVVLVSGHGFGCSQPSQSQ
jgi:hypothetical protein